MPTFFVTPDAVVLPNIRITGTLLHHLRDSLRLQPGETMTVNDGSGVRYRVEITRVTKQSIETRVLEQQQAPARRTPPIILAQALLKGEKMDWVIQKATELGVDRIVPVSTRHSVVKPKADRTAHQRVRWERIAHDAAQQSERWTLPVINDPQDFATACTQLAKAPTRGILAERSTGFSLAAMPLSGTDRDPLVLFIGPEGGWTPEELQLAQEEGYKPLTLGPRILRAETAAIAALSILQSRLDERV